MLFRLYIADYVALEVVLDLFLNFFKTLPAHLGQAYTNDAVTTLLAVFTRDQFNQLTGPGCSGDLMTRYEGVRGLWGTRGLEGSGVRGG